MTVYGATEKLTAGEADWCLHFAKTHNQSLRVECIDNLSGWEPVLPQDMIGSPIEEFWNKAVSLYKWMERTGNLTRSERNHHIDDHRAVMQSIEETLEDGATIDDYEQAAEFLGYHFSLTDPVLYLAPSARSFDSTNRAPEYRAVKLNCLLMPLGKLIDVRGLYRLTELSGHQEYNSSGAPREGHVFLISRLQPCIASRFWTTADPSAFKYEDAFASHFEDRSQLTGKLTGHLAFCKPPLETSEIAKDESKPITPTPQGAAMLATLVVNGNLRQLTAYEADIMYLISAEKWPEGLADKINSLLNQ